MQSSKSARVILVGISVFYSMTISNVFASVFPSFIFQKIVGLFLLANPCEQCCRYRQFSRLPLERAPWLALTFAAAASSLSEFSLTTGVASIPTRFTSLVCCFVLFLNVAAYFLYRVVRLLARCRFLSGGPTGQQTNRNAGTPVVTEQDGRNGCIGCRNHRTWQHA